MYICLCYAVTDRQIRTLVSEGATTVAAVARRTGAGTDCGQCRSVLERAVADAKTATDGAEET